MRTLVNQRTDGKLLDGRGIGERIAEFFRLSSQFDVAVAVRIMRTGVIQTSACARCGAQLTPMQHDHHRCDDAVRAPLIIPIAIPYTRSQEGRCA